MDVAELVQGYLDVFIWPLLVLVLALIFRNVIRGWFSKQPESLTAGPGGVTLKWPDQSPIDDPSPDEYDAEELIEELESDIRAEIEAQVRAEIQPQVWNEVRAQADRALIEPLARRLAEARLERDYERMFNAIFGSQINLLERLRDSGPMSRPAVEGYFGAIQVVNPSLAVWNTDQYLSFLLREGLVEQADDGSYSLATNGLSFLGYLIVRGYSKGLRPN